VDAVDPARLLETWHDRQAPAASGSRFDIVAAGKAAGPMASAFSRLFQGSIHRLIVAGPRPRWRTALERAEWSDAGHPLPNEASVEAGRRALDLARDSAAAGREVVLLLSGGASAMLAVPTMPLSVGDKARTAHALMRAGVPIAGLNCVRRHLSDIKGGRLGAAAGRSLTLAISDVHGPVPDDPAVIGSGPTVPDASTFAEALEVVRSVPDVPELVHAHLRRGADGALPETVKPGDPRLAHARFEVIGTRTTALDGAAKRAGELGYEVVVEGEPTSGEARTAAVAFMSRVRRLATDGRRPLCVLSAGETTVTVSGQGKGGRNQEFALAAAPAIGSLGRASLLASAGTDGVDGPTDAAGAVVDSTTLERSARLGLDWSASLADNDAYHFFEPLGDLISWGPTGTNVGDVHVLLVA
jgi:glycerate-2-kinase